MKKSEKAKEITEDDVKDGEKTIQKLWMTVSRKPIRSRKTKKPKS
jgi:ribosome recycling factor